jgi:CheY-like chemotaxis protein
MIKILLTTPVKDHFLELVAALEKHDDVILTWADSGSHALKMLTEEAPDLLVSDEQVGDISGLELLKKMIRVNPMINSAIVSSLSPDEFHEASEGLGVMAQLPVKPEAMHADELLNRLREIAGLAGRK